MLLYEIDGEVTLKTLESAHAETLFSLIDNHRTYLRRWLPWVDQQTDIECIHHFIEHAEDQLKTNAGLHVGMWYHQELTGVIGVPRIDWPNKSLSFGYWIAEPFQGNGIVSRSLSFLIDFVIAELKINRIEIRCAPTNVRSRNIPERLGFVEEGRLREAEWLNDHYCDHIIYSMLSHEWPKKKKSRNHLE